MRWQLLVMKDILICVCLAAIFLFALFTVPLPTPLATQTVGSFQFSAFPTGFSLYQNVSPSHFYSMSPLDDFVINNQGGRSSLAELNQLQIEKKRATVISSTADVFLGLKSYIGSSSVTYASRGFYPAVYQAEVAGKAIIIRRKITNLQSSKVAVSGMTLKFSDEDFIFDQRGKMYNEKNAEDIAFFNTSYFLNLQMGKVMESIQKTQVKKLFLVNPYLSGTIVIEANENQTLWVNHLSNAIEVTEPLIDPSSSTIITSMKLTVVSSPGETTTQ